MSEREGSAFWDEFGGSLVPENFDMNQYCVEPGIRSLYEESGSRRIRISPDSNHQDGDADRSWQPSPLGLTLSKTPSFLNLLQSKLSKGKNAAEMNQSFHEKLKASNFPAVFIKIGSWQRLTRHEGDLTAKLYYAKRKLVWEVLDGALKSKIEIQWSDIIAMKATMPENEPGVLEVEVNQAPLFYREINPQPRKHTLWQQTSDFTGGQASIWRRHYVTFGAGILDKHYEKLLQCDKQLLELSQKPFPSLGSPYFDPTMFGLSQLSFNRYGIISPTYPTLPRGPSPPNSVMDSSFRNIGESSNQFVSQQQATINWGQLQSHQTSSNQVFHEPNLALLNDIENHLLGDYQSYPLPSDDRATTDVNPSYNANHLTTDADQGMLLQNAQHVSWLPPNDTMAMQQQLTNSPPAAFFFPPNSTSGDFFNP